MVDRTKNLIIRGGENISSAEVEAALYGHPAVAEACVFPLPDARLGEKVAAAVYLRPTETLTKEELTSHAALRLAAYKVPSEIHIWSEQLPRLGSGKIDRSALRAFPESSVSVVQP